MDKQRNSCLYVSISCLTLFSGYLIYFFGRPDVIISAIPTALEHWIIVLPVFAEVSGPLPGFFHSYAFILLTFAVLGNFSRAYLYLSIAVWVCLEAMFEIAQHPLLDESVASFVPTWFEKIPLLDVTARYFLQGTFDPLDLIAILLAAIAVLLTVRIVSGKEFYDEQT